MLVVNLDIFYKNLLTAVPSVAIFRLLFVASTVKAAVCKRCYVAGSPPESSSYSAGFGALSPRTPIRPTSVSSVTFSYFCIATCFVEKVDFCKT